MVGHQKKNKVRQAGAHVIFSSTKHLMWLGMGLSVWPTKRIKTKDAPDVIWSI